MRIISLEDLHQHVLDLWGKDDGIEWVSEVFMPAANHETGTLRLHLIKSETAYAVALHEIGHIRQGRFEDLLIEERRAWEWARENALIWTPTMEREAERSIRDHETGDDEGPKATFYYDQILGCVNDLLVGGNTDGEQVYDALIRNAVELDVPDGWRFECTPPKLTLAVAIAWLNERGVAQRTRESGCRAARISDRAVDAPGHARMLVAMFDISKQMPARDDELAEDCATKALKKWPRWSLTGWAGRWWSSPSTTKKSRWRSRGRR
jgi:hypothetical protein